MNSGIMEHGTYCFRNERGGEERRERGDMGEEKEKEKKEKEKEKRRVCVTGGGGFVASWLVAFLLQLGYHVHATVRSLENERKFLHLKRLDGADERLTLFEADILDYESIFAAIKGCVGVFHTACPVPSHTSSNPEVEVLNPAVNGTLNVLRACSNAQIKRVVLTSSVSAISGDPNRPREIVVDESLWSDAKYCKESKNWYMLGKTLAEQEAWAYAKDVQLDMVVICPGLVLGPLLQSTVNASSLILLNFLNGSSDTYHNALNGVVDVRDVAKSHILAYEMPSASGRYLCVNRLMRRREMVEILHSLFPNYTPPTKWTEEDTPWTDAISTQKIQDLGLVFTPIEDTLSDTVKSLQDLGFLNP